MATIKKLVALGLMLGLTAAFELMGQVVNPANPPCPFNRVAAPTFGGQTRCEIPGGAFFREGRSHT
jgi:hypothetical protein